MNGLVQKALFVLLGVLVSLSLAWSQRLNDDVQEQGRAQAAVGAQIEALRRDVNRVENTLQAQDDRLNAKLDRLLDKERK